MCSWLSVALYAFALFISTFFLPESIPSVIEKNELLASFELVEQTSTLPNRISLPDKTNNVSLLDYGTSLAFSSLLEESKKIQEEFLATLHKQGRFSFSPPT